MAKIIAGRFDTTVDADAAVEALRRDGFAREEIDSFYVAPPGQHGLYPLGGDADADAGALRGLHVIGRVGDHEAACSRRIFSNAICSPRSANASWTALACASLLSSSVPSTSKMIP